ncbi:hypothetical protein [Aeromonas veronii]|uniref:hypothetical protein n=1 Tax=Aeromonas veronii TaxID=654 RepID=UPI0011164C75|nr:hypothetical protein [Aeromonas veronii]
MKNGQLTRLTALAHQFRLGQSVAASQALPELLQEVFTEQGNLPPGLVAALLQCQERQDWLGLADYLEYEVVHSLSTPAGDTNTGDY